MMDNILGRVAVLAMVAALAPGSVRADGGSVAVTIAAHGKSEHVALYQGSAALLLGAPEPLAASLRQQGFAVAVSPAAGKVRQEVARFLAAAADADSRVLLWLGDHDGTADLPLADLVALMEASAARHILAVIATCASPGNALSAAASKPQAALDWDATLPARQYLLYCAKGEGAALPASFAALLAKDSAADLNRDGLITGRELAAALAHTGASLMTGTGPFGRGDMVFTAGPPPLPPAEALGEGAKAIMGSRRMWLPAPSVAYDGTRMGGAGASPPQPGVAMSASGAAHHAKMIEVMVAPAPPPPTPAGGGVDGERYGRAATNPVQKTAEQPVSTFSIDVDTASYANVRRFLRDGGLPPRDAVRIEEMVNYFRYDYPLPEDKAVPFRPTVTVMPTPWDAKTSLLHIAIKGYDLAPAARPRANLVFLIDTSGSMHERDRLPLLKQSLRLLVQELKDDDTVAIVAYAGSAGTVLEPTPGRERGTILAALERLQSGGSTAGGEGILAAYALAERTFDAKAVNRVILGTDGDFNVGVADPDRLEDLIAGKRKTGIYLSILGFGTGNLNDLVMQKLAQAGNGIAAYIDGLAEARRVLVDEMASSLFTIADDVKIQVEFNPARVAEYRLVGYETRMLKREDFANDAVDAGEVGSGHAVTAIYEITPPGSGAELIPPLRYGKEAAGTAPAAKGEEYAHLRIRYKLPGTKTSRLIERPVTEADAVSTFDAAPAEPRFAVAVAAFAQVLRGDAYLKDDFGLSQVLSLAQPARGADPFGHRAEFIQLVRAAQVASPSAATRQR